MAQEQLQDLTGKIQNVNVVGAGAEVMNMLAQAMKAAVAPITSGTNQVADKLQEIIDEEKAREKRLENFLEKEFPKSLHKEFSKDLEKVKENLEDCKNHLSNISKKQNNSMKSAGSVLKMLQGALGSIGGGGKAEELEEISKRACGISDNVKQITQDYDSWVKSSKLLSTHVSYLRDATGDLINSLDDSNNETDSLNKKFLNLSSILENIDRNQRLKPSKYKQLRNEVQKLLKLTIDYNASEVKTSDALNTIIQQHEKLSSLASKLKLKYEAIATLSGVFARSFANYSNKIIGGLISDLDEWEKESTHMAATLTSAIHSAGGASSELVEEFRNLLEVSREVIETTHQFPAVVRREWAKAIKRGTRNLNETRKVITNALSAAWQVGASAESTADEFQKWNMYIGMSSTGSLSLARTMSTVSKVTGVMGDHLLQAVSSAREIAQQMKDTGIYSQETANSVVSWMASAQKFGIDRQVQNIFRASQGGLEAFMEASSETRNLLAASGQLGNVLGGNADPDVVMGGVGDAIRRALPANIFQRDAQGKPVGLPDLKKLSKSEISRLDLIMKRRFGMKLGEAVRLLEGIQDQNPAEKLEQIERDLANPTITKAEKEQLELLKKQVEIARDEKKLTTIMDGLATMSEAAKSNGATFESMLRQARMTEQTFRQGVQESAQLLSQKLERQGKTFDEAMGMSRQQFQDQMTSLIAGMRNGDVNSRQQFRELYEKMAEANKMADSAAKNNSNTADKQETQQQILQNALQNISKPLHTLVLQASLLWTWNLVSIAGGIWALHSLITAGRISENIASVAASTATLRKRGSGYVHDIHTEKYLKLIYQNMRRGGALNSRRGAKVGEAGDLRIPGKIKEGPKAELPQAKMSGSDSILKGAAKLTAIAAGVVALGTILVLAAKAIMSISGFDAKQAKEVAWVLGVVIGAGAGALLAAAVAMKAMEFASKTIKPGMLGTLLKGGLLLAAMLIPMSLLALALIGLGALLSYIVEPKKAAEYASAVASILVSAGIVAGAVLGATLVVSALGALAMFAPFLVPLMLLGSVALLILTPAMLALAGAVIGMTSLLSKSMDPKTAVQTANATADIMLSAFKIAGAVLGAAGFMAALGGLSLIAWIMIPLIWLGSKALQALTPAMIGIAKTIIDLASGLVTSTDADTGKKAAKSTSEILEAAFSIAKSVVTGRIYMSSLSMMSGIVSFLVPSLDGAAVALGQMAESLLSVSLAVIEIAKSMISRFNPKEAGAIAKSVSDILESVFKISKSIGEGSTQARKMGSILPLVWIIAPAIQAGGEALRQLAIPLTSFINAIIDVSKGITKDIKTNELKLILDVMKSIGDTVVSVANMMTSLNEKILPMLKSGMFSKSLADKLKEKMPQFSEYFKTITKELVAGIIKPIADMPANNQMQTASAKMTSILRVLDLLPKFMSDLNEKINKVSSIRLTANAQGIDRTVGNLAAITSSLFTLANVMMQLSQIMETISSIDIDLSNLEQIGGVFKSGKLEMSIQGSQEPVEGTSFSKIFEDWSAKILGVFTGVRAPHVSAQGGLLSGMNKGISQTLGTPLDNMGNATNQVGSGVKKLSSGLNKFAPANDKLDLINKSIVDTGVVSQTNRIVELLANIEKNTDADSEKNRSRGTAVSRDELDRQVQARVEQNRPSNGMMSVVEYLAAIAAHTDSINDRVADAVDVLEDIHGELKASRRGGDAAPEGPARSPRARPRYHEWRFGRFSDTTAKQRVNTGGR